jgi:tetratricopeptide (TPR) repeat protein
MPVKHGRLKLLAAIALCLIAGVAALPLGWRSDLVARQRAAFHLKRAQAQVSAGKLDEARSGFRASLNLQPGDADARRQLAAMELSRGNWELAFLEYQSLTDMHPEDAAAWIALADMMSAQGWLEAPEAALDRAIEAAPEQAGSHARRGEIRFRLGRYSGARADAQASLATAPGGTSAWALLVRSVAKTEGADAGIEAATRGLAAVGRSRALLLPLARLLDDRGRTGEALQALEETAGPSDDAFRARLRLAREQLNAGRRGAASEMVAKATEGELGPPPPLRGGCARTHRPTSAVSARGCASTGRAVSPSAARSWRPGCGSRSGRRRRASSTRRRERTRAPRSRPSSRGPSSSPGATPRRPGSASPRRWRRRRGFPP